MQAKPADPALAAVIPGALAFASAEMVVVFLHECAHALAALGLGFHPIVYAFYENNPSGDRNQDAIIAAAGPLASLLFGAITMYSIRRRRGYSYFNLLLFWFGFLGVAEFINYAIVTPWFTAGDTGLIAERLGISVPARYLISLIGWVMLWIFGRPAIRAMLRFAPPGSVLTKPADRLRFARRMLFLPYMLGLALYAPAGIGTKAIHVFYGLLGTAGNGGALQFAVMSAPHIAQLEKPPSGEPPRITLAAVAGYLICLAFYVFVLARGLPI